MHSPKGAEQDYSSASLNQSATQPSHGEESKWEGADWHLADPCKVSIFTTICVSLANLHFSLSLSFLIYETGTVAPLQMAVMKMQ